MRSASPALVAALAARVPMWSADLFTFTLRDGSIHRWTAADQDIAWEGATWSSLGPAIERSSWSAKNTTEIPELVIQLWSTGTDFAPGNIKRMIHDGLFDGATVALSRVFMTTFGDTSLGTVLLFGGRCGRIDIDAIGAKITCEAANVVLTQYLPRNTYQLGCIHTLYDAGCTLNRAAFTATFTVSEDYYGELGFIPVAEAVTIDRSAFVLGTATIVDGVAAGQSRTVEAFWPQGITLAYPLLIAPQPGDHLTLLQGCDKTQARCAVFGNSDNFRGFPTIPPATTGI